MPQPVLSHNQLLRSMSRPNIEDQADTSSSPLGNGLWFYLVMFSTILIPNPVLSCFGMKTRKVQHAWREKFTLCMAIVAACCLLALLTYGMSTIICRGDDHYVFSKLYKANFDGKKIVFAKGGLYTVEDTHRYYDVLTELDKKNITSLFPISVDSCKRQFGQQVIAKGMEETNLSLKDDSNLSRIGPIYYTWSDIVALGYISVYFKVYDCAYCSEEFYHDFITKYAGKDGSKAFDKFKRDEQNCFKESFLAGEHDFKSWGCLCADISLYVSTVAIFGLIITRFCLATIYCWVIYRRTARLEAMMRQTRTGCFLLMTCYSESEEGLERSMSSLAAQEYPFTHKLLFVICDGLILGEASTNVTPDIVMNLIDEDTTLPAQPKMYSALAGGLKRINSATVRMGDFRVRHTSHCCRAIVITKVGYREEGQAKAGNRGKRDSQVIIMGFYNRLLYKDRLHELDFEIYKKIYYSMPHCPPENFEVVLMIDADTEVHPRALGFMVRNFEYDKKIVGMCGETKIKNKARSWVTAIQVFEYYISHHLSKAFESVFGGVTCLPGCFCGYKVQTIHDIGSRSWSVPILGNSMLLKDYSSFKAETLHEKNLLLLGEDRYLTTLLLKNFFRRKLIFVPAAQCYTEVPDQFRILLSQRRRWINSTIHNLFELVTVNNLCGTFCYSMQFVVMMELAGTLVLPAAIVFTGVLLAVSFFYEPAWIPLIMLVGILGLPAILIFLTTFEVTQLFWLIIYIFSLPVWNFILPVYAFWHFDDFSWGETRKVENDDRRGHDNDDERVPEDAIHGLLKFRELDDWKASDEWFSNRSNNQ